MADNRDNTEGTERNPAAGAYQAVRERTASAYEAARSRATDVTRQATDQLAIYPVGAVVGGFLAGALVAFLLPRTEREDALLGKTGRRLTDAARDAAQRGLEAGKEQIEDIRGKAAQKVGEAVADVVGGKQ